MFQLQVSDTNVSSGTLSVSWCLDKALLDHLKENHCVNPSVVIVVSPADKVLYNKSKEIRKVVPLKDMLAYVEFKSPGKQNIWAFVVEGAVKPTQNMFMATGWHGEYMSDVLNSDGSNYCQSFDESKEAVSEPIMVVVPKECFAKEPSDIEKAWVNWLHHKKAIDQCDFRRRRLFAYTVQPVIMLLNLLARLVVTIFALVVGFREFSLRPLLHPIDIEVGDVLQICSGGSIFFKFGPNKVLNVLRAMLFPPIVLLASALVYFHGLLVLLGAIVVIALFSAVVAAIAYIVEYFSNREDDKEKEDTDLWYQNEEDVNALLCSDGSAVKTISSLPKNRRTIRLRFLDLKSKVCRPFAA